MSYQAGVALELEENRWVIMDGNDPLRLCTRMATEVEGNPHKMHGCTGESQAASVP